MKTRLEQDVADRKQRDQIKAKQELEKKIAAERAAKIKDDQFFLDTFNKYFGKLKNNVAVTINKKEHWASFDYEGTKHYIMRVEKWDDTNIPDEGYTPHWYTVWVIRRGSIYQNNQYSGFVPERSNEAYIGLGWRLDETDIYETVLKGLRELNDGRL